jgi:hypothetical protein
LSDAARGKDPQAVAATTPSRRVPASIILIQGAASLPLGRPNADREPGRALGRMQLPSGLSPVVPTACPMHSTGAVI